MSDQSAPKKLTDFKHLNLYSTELKTERGSVPWIYASRKDGAGPKRSGADAVAIIAIVNAEDEPRLVVTREYRAPLGAFEIAPPAGLIDPGESVATAGARELREETGLELTRVLHVSPPLASSAGMTDESVALLYAEAQGVPSREHLTEHESIETKLMSLADIRVLLKNPGSDIISCRLYPVMLAFLAAGAIELRLS